MLSGRCRRCSLRLGRRASKAFFPSSLGELTVTHDQLMERTTNSANQARAQQSSTCRKSAWVHEATRTTSTSSSSIYRQSECHSDEADRGSPIDAACVFVAAEPSRSTTTCIAAQYRASSDASSRHPRAASHRSCLSPRLGCEGFHRRTVSLLLSPCPNRTTWSASSVAV